MTHKAYALQAFPGSELNEAVQEQTEAQAELESGLEQNVQAIVPEIFKTVEISYYGHNIYASDKLIASITHDSDDFVTQPWIVAINNVEIHRANTWAKCYHYITWHYKKGTLPIQREKTESVTTTNVEKGASHFIKSQALNFLTNDESSCSIKYEATLNPNPERETPAAYVNWFIKSRDGYNSGFTSTGLCSSG